jgi:beta-glucosidase
VEGNSFNNQWYEFETSNQSRILNNDVSGIATNHWDLYKSDVALMKKDLHVNAYRFSIEWSKIEPQRGIYNHTVINHYHAMIDDLLATDIEPMVTIHHFTSKYCITMNSFQRSFMVYSTGSIRKNRKRRYLCKLRKIRIFRIFQGEKVVHH